MIQNKVEERKINVLKILFKKTNIRFQILSRNISIHDATNDAHATEQEKTRKKCKRLINFVFTTLNGLLRKLN